MTRYTSRTLEVSEQQHEIARAAAMGGAMKPQHEHLLAWTPSPPSPNSHARSRAHVCCCIWLLLLLLLL